MAAPCGPPRDRLDASVGGGLIPAPQFLRGIARVDGPCLEITHGHSAGSENGDANDTLPPIDDNY